MERTPFCLLPLFPDGDWGNRVRVHPRCLPVPHIFGVFQAVCFLTSVFNAAFFQYFRRVSLCYLGKTWPHLAFQPSHESSISAPILWIKKLSPRRIQ